MTILPGLIDMHVHLDSSPALRRLHRPAVHRQLLVGAGDGARPAPCSRPASPPSATSAPSGYSDVGLQAGDRRRAMIPGRASCPPRYALGATGGHCDSTYLPAVDASEEQRRRRRQPGGAAHARARAAQVRRRGDQGLRHRRRLLAQHRARPAAALRGGDEGHRRRGAPLGPQGRRARARRRRHQATPSAPASTPSSTPA